MLLLTSIFTIGVLLFSDACFGSNKPGEKCDNGVCEFASRCHSALESIKNGIIPKICGFEGSNLEPTVCCHDLNESKSLLKNFQNPNIVHFHREKPPIYKKKCFEYATKACNGILKLGSSGDWEKKNQKKFPHTAIIGHGDFLDIHWKCGGSLITEFHILTVAHCEYTEFGYARWARLGTEISSSHIYEIIQRIIHPNYHYPSLQDDIAIFKLKEKIYFDPHVHPICLFNDEPFEQIELFSVGFQRKNCLNLDCQEIDSAEQDKLQLDVIIKTPSNLRDSWYCAELFENYLELSEGFNPESTVCTHLTVSFSNECQGTPGDALLHSIETGCPFFHNLVGISSVIGHWPNEYGCNFLNTSVIYTKISPYLPWIEDVVWKEHPKTNVPS